MTIEFGLAFACSTAIDGVQTLEICRRAEAAGFDSSARTVTQTLVGQGWGSGVVSGPQGPGWRNWQTRGA